MQIVKFDDSKWVTKHGLTFVKKLILFTITDFKPNNMKYDKKKLLGEICVTFFTEI